MIIVKFHIAHPSQKDTYGAAMRDVTEYCTDVSWSFSLNAPYEAMDLLLDFPLESFINKDVIPIVDGLTPDTGFWVSITERGADKQEGALLALGRVDAVNMTVATERASGGLFCQAQVSATSWVWFLGDHHFTLTEFKVEKTAKVSQEFVDYINKFFIGADAIKALYAPLFEASEQLQGTYTDTFRDQLETVYANFAESVAFPESLGGNALTNVRVIDPNTFRSDLEVPFAELEEHLARTGLCASVPPGYIKNAYLLPDGGVWSWLTNTFAFDPNYIELYPTLLPMGHFADWKGFPGTTKWTSPLKMVPALIYKMKPVHYQLAGEEGPRSMRDYSKTGALVFEGEGKEAEFYPKHRGAPSTSFKIDAGGVEAFTFQVSENRKVNMVATRRPYDGVAFGYGFSHQKPPEIMGERMQGYGIRYQEMGWPMYHREDKVYRFLNEYLVSLAFIQEKGTGSFTADYIPGLKAGQWFSLEGGDTSVLRGFLGYVEEVTHSVSVSGNGVFALSTDINFSGGIWGALGETDAGSATSFGYISDGSQ